MSDDRATLSPDIPSSDPAAPDVLFAGPGEMRARCREFDWAATPLGPVATWPQSLRTIVEALLASAFPNIVLWGRDLVQIYNDGYIPILGAKHPRGLGIPTRECWPEAWAFNEPIYERVFAGETIAFEDQLYRLARNGPDQPLDDVYITLSYSPVRDEVGEVGGVLVTLVETTGRVMAQRLEREREQLLGALQLERARLAAVFQHSPSFLAVLRGPDNVFELVNDAYEQIVGRGRDVIGKPLFEAMPETRGQGFDEYLAHVRTTGESLVFRDLPVLLDRTPGAPREERFVDITYLPLVESDGTHDAVIAHGTDVTEQVRARRETERLLRESEESRAAAESANELLQQQTLELELTNRQLQENGAELEMQAEELQATAAALEERTEEAENARRTLATIVEAVTDGFVAFDSSLRYTYVNRRAEEMWRLPAERLLGKTPAEVWPGLTRSPFIAMFDRVRRSGRPEVLEEHAASLGVRIEVRAYPASGGGVVAFFSDVTERRRAEEAAAFMAEASRLLASATDYHSTLANLAAAAVPRLGDWCAVDVVTSSDGTVWPPTLERLAVVHQDPAKLQLAQALTTRYPPDWSADTGTPAVLRTRKPMFVPNVTDAMLSAGARDEHHLALLRELRIRSIMIVPLIARERVLGAMTLVMAESERRFTNDDLALALDLGQRAGIAIDNARLLREAQEANASKSQFLANMSHELRQPLNAISGYADLVAMGVRGPVTEQQRGDLERIKSSSMHLTALISDILQFARLEAGHLEYHMTSVPVDATLREVASFVEPRIRAKQLEFTLGTCGADIAVHADRERFVRAMLNVLTNAAKYTPEGGAISVSCSTADDETVRIRVADTGVGIPRDKLESIFDPFMQVDRSLSRPSEGVGLGLAIARDIARTMGGDLTVQSEERVGSTFTLTLPRA